MKLSVVSLLVMVLPVATASEPQWPGKGDTVYISASFKGLTGPAIVAGATVTYDMPPCKELVVTKADPKKSVWVTKDALGGSERLEGPWLSRIHKTKTECEEHQSSAGEPKVVKSGGTFTIQLPA